MYVSAWHVVINKNHHKARCNRNSWNKIRQHLFSCLYRVIQKSKQLSRIIINRIKNRQRGYISHQF